MFDVQATPEDWIVLGKKKGFYLADVSVPCPFWRILFSSLTSGQTGETMQQQIVLVPMRSGTLFLPSVSIQHVSGAQHPDAEPLVCETYVENAAEVVHVLPSKRSIIALVPLREAWVPGLEEGLRV